MAGLQNQEVFTMLGAPYVEFGESPDIYDR